MATGYSVGNLEMSIQTVGNGAVTSLTLTNAQLKQMLRLVSGNNSQLGKMGGNFQKTFSFAKALAKIYFIRNYTKQLASTMVGLVQNAINYTETLNLWQVAMRGNISTAEEFVSKMNKAYGIAEETLMRYQATFRNMLSTLGGISTDVSYGLSEYLTQMALDYASLYNTSIERAMTVFQSVLSGQVRPIRSISGYDITETTIFQLYQQLGGTKTMRQLSQTEKRLLHIYAVFQQMDRSGAIGDLNKTLNNTANQMRIMSESAKELGMWFGKLIELYVAPALPYLNAFLITSKNIIQAFVKGLPQYSEFDGTIKGYKETAEAMDEVQGKLLDFDKFRSLSGQENNALGIGIDENLIAGLTRYQSILENVSNKATEIAEKWTSWFVNDGTEKLTIKAKGLFSILSALSGLGIFKLISKKALTTKIPILVKTISFMTSPLGKIVGILSVLYITNEKFRKSINNLISASLHLLVEIVEPFTEIAGLISVVFAKVIDVAISVVTVLIDIVTWVVKLIDKLNILKPLIYIILAYKTVGWITSTYTALLPLIAKTEMFLGILFNAIKNKGLGTLISSLFASFGKWVVSATKSIGAFLGTTQGLFASISVLIIGVSSFISNFDKLSNKARIWIPVLASLAGVITAVALGLTVMKGNWLGAISLGAMVTGAGLMVGTALATPKQYKDGGLVEDGLFTMNKGEVMGTFDDGTSIVANNQQIISGIKQGVYQAVSQAMANSGRTDDRPIEVIIDGEKVFQATKKNAKRHGLAFSKV